MIYVSDIQQLIDSWIRKRDLYSPSSPYRDALCDCIYDLGNLIRRYIDEQFSYQEYLDMQADEYLSSMEAFEQVA